MVLFATSDSSVALPVKAGGPTRSLLALHAVYLKKQVNLPASTRKAPRAEYTRLHVIQYGNCVYFHLQNAG